MSEVVSFEQIVQRGCGLNVHKQTVVATIDGAGLPTSTMRHPKNFSRSFGQIILQWICVFALVSLF
jgi:hypothetical protein